MSGGMSQWEGILGLIYRCRSRLIPCHTSNLHRHAASLNIPIWVQRLCSVCYARPHSCSNFGNRPEQVRGKLEESALGIFVGGQEGCESSSDEWQPRWERETWLIPSETMDHLLALKKNVSLNRSNWPFSSFRDWMDGYNYVKTVTRLLEEISPF